MSKIEDNKLETHRLEPYIFYLSVILSILGVIALAYGIWSGYELWG